ncbi:hypothetical protein JOF53_006466 [Crossiella equi]|uniref:Uncharacterized protein n=1 Tax=Crossiella equi TaxID=130796 RepID=A0ABS5AN32_9PSEU|nr:hypothetical protein [Crossiella equi]MBP2477594.1 hypothetical protein [Crossiella equi]
MNEEQDTLVHWGPAVRELRDGHDGHQLVRAWTELMKAAADCADVLDGKELSPANDAARSKAMKTFFYYFWTCAFLAEPFEKAVRLRARELTFAAGPPRPAADPE